MATATKTFEYAVRDKRGKVVKGRIEANNSAAVANRLRTMGMAPISITEFQVGGLKREIKIPGLSGRIKLKDLSIMARQLATMITAGLSLLRALSILADQTANPALAKILAQVRNDVETGASFSASLSKHKETFPPLMINMIKAGEVGGFLDQVLLSIAENFEAEVKLHGKIKSAMTYPIVVFIIAILAVTGMLLFIVPVFAKMFADLGGELPPLTKVLVGMSTLMKVTIGPLIVGLVVFSAWWGKNKNNPGVRDKVDPLKLKTPIFGQLVQEDRHLPVHPQLRDDDPCRRPDPAGPGHRGSNVRQCGDRARGEGGPGVGTHRPVADRTVVPAPGVPADGRADDGRR